MVYLSSLIKSSYSATLNPQLLYSSLKFRFTHTAITSKLTSYVLVLFWLFFIFYGDSLFMIVFNYSTPVDTITSSMFFTIKQHAVFYLTTISVTMLLYLNFYIFFLTGCSFIFLLNFNYSYRYNYFHEFYIFIYLIFFGNFF